MADVPLQKGTGADGRCPARTGDLLLVRREQLLRSTAACRSGRSANDRPHIAAALCCGSPLPERFQCCSDRSPVPGHDSKSGSTRSKRSEYRTGDMGDGGLRVSATRHARSLAPQSGLAELKTAQVKLAGFACVRKRGRASREELDSAPCLLGAEGDDVEVVDCVLPTAGGEASVRALVGAAAADDLAGDSAVADVTEQRRDAERAVRQRDLALAEEADPREPPGSIHGMADEIQLSGSGAARVEQWGCDRESVAWRDSPRRFLPGELCKRPNIQKLECGLAPLLGERERGRVRHVRGGGAGAGDQGERPDRECHGRHHREALHGYLLVCCSESAAQLRVRTKLPFGTTLTPK